MSNGTLTPQKVDPGWFMRWSTQSFDLWRRSPISLISFVIIASFVNMWIPQPLGADMLVDVPLFGGVFLLIRLLDQHGYFAWEPFRAMAMDAWKDLWQLTKVTFLWIFFLSILVTLISLMAKSAMSSVAGPSKLDGILHHVLSQAPAFLQNSFWQGLGMIGNAGNPFLGPMLFLTLYLGANTIYYLHIAYLGCIKNLPIMVMFFISAVASPLVIKLIVALLINVVGANFTLLLASLLMSVVCILMSTFGYLWSREMFEGTKENKPAKAEMKLVLASVGKV